MRQNAEKVSTEQKSSFAFNTESTKVESMQSSTCLKSKEADYSPASYQLLKKNSSMFYTPTPDKEKKRKYVQLPPGQLMKQRWEKQIVENVPYID